MGGAGVTAPVPLTAFATLQFMSNRKRKPNPVVPPEAYNPFTDYIMLEPELEAEVSDGGIHIPEAVRKFLNEGKILKKGPDVSDLLRNGMFVVFEQSSEYRLDIGGGKVVFVVKESNVILYREDVAGRLFPAKEKIPALPAHTK